MNELKTYDVAIAGGGLAGLSLAIQCASKNISVVLFEKEIYPFHKVCGEYISMESKPFLESLGIPFSSLQLPEIKRLKLSDLKGNLFNFNLPLGGFGISRYALDKLLYDIAVDKGATIITGAKVVDITFENDFFTINSSAGKTVSKTVAGAWGKRSNIDIKWNRSFAQQKPGKLNNYVGIKYHINYKHPGDEIALHNFYDGYCGLSKIEEDKSCLCYLTTAENLRRNNNSISEMEQKLLFKNPRLKEIFSDATFLYKQPIAISQISFERKKTVENNVLMLGDAAGLISPLCGNGMSMALHASKLAFSVLEKYLFDGYSRKQMEIDYGRLWEMHFARRLTTGRIVQRFFGRNNATSLFLNTMKIFPALANRIICLTHGEPY